MPLRRKRSFLTAFNALILFALSFPAMVLAEGDLGEKTASPKDAILKADAYTWETGNIAVLIRYGKGNARKAEDLGVAFVNAIKQRGWNARYFYYEADWKGASVEYHIRAASLGPWSPKEAAGNVSKAVEMAKAAHRFHNP